jgi:iron complex outermembrane receptor protein
MREGRRRSIRICALAGAAALAMIHAASAQESLKHFDIKATDLATALEQFGHQSDKEILFNGEQARRLKAPVVVGDYPPEAALQKLLAGSGLSERRVNAETFVVEARAAAAPAGETPAIHPTQAAAAQINEPAASPSANPEVPVEEVIVTAQKRAENVQNVPKVVQVLKPGKLDQAGVTNIQDLNLISPSVQGISNVQFTPPAIRGISSFSLSLGTQTQTGVVLDDIPQPSFSTLANELTDIERVEVLPGPQSTLSGRNAAGGLINIVTHSPSNDFLASFKAEQTGDDQTRLAGFISGPINDALAYSLSAYWDKWDGSTVNLGENGRNLDGWDQRGVRAKLKWQATDSLAVTVTGFYTYADFDQSASVSGTPYVFAAPNASNLFAGGKTIQELYPRVQIGPYNRDIEVPGHGHVENENKGGSFRIDYDTGIGTLSSIGSYSESAQPARDLLLGYPFRGQLVFDRADVNVDYESEEVRLVSPSDLEKIQYLLAAIYTSTDNFRPYERTIIAPINFNTDVSQDSTALYGRGTYEFIEDTSLTLGLRYQYDSQRYGFVFLDHSGPNSSGSTAYDFVSGEASLQHNFTPDIKGYFTYANEETGEVYDIGDLDDAKAGGLKPLPSQKVQSYEAGLKTQWLEHRLTANLSLFDAQYQNYQVDAFQLGSVGNGGLPVLRLFAIGKVEDKGIELETSFAATEDLTVGLSATYLDASIVSYPNAQCYNGQTAAQGCVPINPNNPNGQKVQRNLQGPLPGTSRFRGIATINYTLPLPSLPFDATFGLLYRYQTNTHYDLFGDPASRQGSFGVLNLSAGITDRDRHYSFEVFVNNVTDRRYYAGLAQAILAQGATIEATYDRDSFRYAGVRLKYDF